MPVARAQRFDFKRAPDSPVARLGLACLLVAAATGAALLVPGSSARDAFLLYLIAVMAATCWGGVVMGLMALLLSLAACAALPIAYPSYKADVMMLGAFLGLIGLITITLIHRLTLSLAWKGEMAKEALRRSILIDASKDGMFVLDERGAVVECNAAFAGALGYTMQEIRGTHVWDWDADRPRELVERKMPAYEPRGESFEVRHRRKDGSLIDVEITATSAMWEGRKYMYCVCRDISARRRAEATLREQEELYRSIVDSARDGIVLIDPKTLRFIEFNDAACAELGYTREEFAALSLLDIGGGRLTAADILARMHDSLAAGGMRFEVKHRTKGGEARDRLVSNRVVDIRGHRYLSSIWHDITDKARAELALLQSEARLRYVLAATGEGVWDWNLATQRVDHNVRWCQLIGLPDTYAEHHRQDYEERIHPADRAAVARRLHACLQGKATYRSEHRVRREDGSYLWVLDRGDVVERSADGEPLRMVGCLADIAERKRIDHEEQGHRERLEALVVRRTQELEQANQVLADRALQIDDLYDRAPCGYHTLDADGVVQTMNDTELHWLGYTREEVEGRMRVEELIAPEQRARYEARIGHLRTDDHLSNAEYDLMRRDGSRMPVLITAAAERDEAGRLLAVRATVSDNTERKLREREIAELSAQLAQRAAEAEAANQAKNRFLTNVSHEIRTPLNGILGLTHLLRRDASDPLQLERLRKLDETGQQLLAMTNAILDIAKIEADRMQLLEDDFDLESLLEHACAPIAHSARSKQLELIVELDGQLPPRVRGDAMRLHQVLVNHLGNAVKYTDCGFIALRAQLAGNFADELVVRFEIADSGIGIPPHAQARLFDAFEQAAASDSRRRGGAGLGLAVNRRIVQLMGGELGVDSEAGSGSTFWFTVRLRRALIDQAATRQPAPLRDMKVLVAHPMPQASLALARALRGLGAKPVSIAHGDELPAAREFAPDGFDATLVDESLQTSMSQYAERGQFGLCLILVGSEASAQAARREGWQWPQHKPMLPGRLSRLLSTRTSDSADLETKTEPLVIVTDGRNEATSVKLLLAEDNLVNQEVALEMLTDAGFEVDVATHGAQAVAMAGSTQYDLILMDVQMPGMDGLQATQKIRAFPGYQTTPILAMTANAFEEDRERCIRAGMNAHIAKPVDGATLVSTVGAWLPASKRPVRADSQHSNSEEDDALRARIAAIPGLDLDKGLRFAGGRVDRYASRLLTYARSHVDAAEALRRHCSAANFEEAEQLAHSLRGAAAFIGAEELKALAGDLESSLRARSPSPQIEALSLATYSAETRLIEAIAQLTVPRERAAAAP